jgi:hypothetical protein
MRMPAKIFRVVMVASTVALSSCNSKGVFSSPLYLAVTVTPRPASLPEGSGTAVLTAVVSNNLSLPQWSLLNAADTSSVGTLTPITNSPNSILYTAPPAPPIYNSGAPAGIQQGAITVQAIVSPPAGSTLPVAQDSVSIFITAPTVTISPISPSIAAVPVNGTQAFTGYEIGSVVNTFTWQVNGVTGGSFATGMINFNGVYTAPSSIPMTGNTVTITMISQADPTKSASAVVTLTP